MSPLCQVMSVPVSTSAAKEMAARASRYTPRLIPTSTAKAVKREAKPAYLPCRLSRAVTGGPAGGAPPARAVMTPPRAAAAPAGRRAGRAGVRAAAKPPHPAGDDLIEPDGLAADHVEHLARDAAGGRRDNGAQVGLLDQGLDVDVLDEVIEVYPLQQAVQVDPVQHPVDVDLIQHGVQIDLVQQRIDIQRGNHKPDRTLGGGLGPHL